MILEAVLEGVWSKSTLSKKIKELSAEMSIDFSLEQTNEIIAESIKKLIPKSRGKAKTSLEEIFMKLAGSNNNEEPSWDSEAGITIDSTIGKKVEKAEVVNEVEKSDIEILMNIFNKMGVEV